MKFELIRSNKMDMRTAFKSFYINKFFNMWMKKFKFGQLDYQEIFYIMKKYWFEGTIACSKRLNPPEVAEMLPKCVFTPWVLSGVYNCYDFPTSARCINVRAVSYISNKVLEIDKEIVIGWCQPNHKGVYSSIDAKIHQLVDLEMIIRVCTKNQKSPWIIAFSPEDEKAVKQLIEDMDGDDPVLTTMLKDLKNTKALTSGAPFIVDRISTALSFRSSMLSWSFPRKRIFPYVSVCAIRWVTACRFRVLRFLEAFPVSFTVCTIIRTLRRKCLNGTDITTSIWA